MGPVGTQSIWKTSAWLADGREIVYCDESPGLGRELAPDTRPLPPRPPGPPLPVGTAESGIRWDPLAGEWVVIAAARQDRTFLPPPDQCPLDPSAPGRPTEIPASSYDVVVFENRFPSLREPLGRCEVICFTSDHYSSFAQLTPARVRTVFEAWADRTLALSALPGTEQVYCFENRGEEIGVTLSHPHGQIYAFPFVTPRTERMVAQARGYNGDNLFDDLVAAELRAGTRIVTRNEHWIVFVPEAARWPYEVRIFPTARVPDLPSVGAAASVDTGTDWSLASVAAGIGVPAGGDAWSTVPEPDPPPATLTITRTATTSTTSAMATIPYVRVRARRASWAARCLAS